MSEQNSTSDNGEIGQWGRVALFWAFVGVPLAWGVIETFIKASQLF